MSLELSVSRKIAAYYDKIDGHYDDLYSSPVCIAEDRVVMSLLTPYITQDSSILDIGCGTGLVPSNLNGNRYLGIDVSSTELQTAIEKLPEHIKDFMVADMHNIPVGNKSFDLLISTYGPFSYSQTPESARDEAMRPLKSGGRFLIMPYTKRTGMAIGLGGSTAAIDGEVPRIYYTESEAKKIFSCIDGVKILGINYLANLIVEKLDNEDFVPTIDDKFLNDELIHLVNRMGEGNADKFQNKTINFDNLITFWRRFRKNRQNIDLLTEILYEEIKIFEGILPAHFARHMAVTGVKQ